MSAISNFTLKSLRANRVRTLVTIAGVMLATALITAVMTTYTSLNGFLYDVQKERNGDWMSVVHTSDLEAEASNIAQARHDSHVTTVVTMTDQGFAELTEEQQNFMGAYLPLATYTGNIEETCGIRPSAGRLPTSGNEILLPEIWDTMNVAQIGETIQLSVGDRRAITIRSSDDSMSITTGPASGAAGSFSTDIEEGALLDSSVDVLSELSTNGTFTEELVNKESQAYVVVGFYAPFNYASSCNAGSFGIIGPHENVTGPTSIYLSYRNVDSLDQIEKITESLFPDNDNVVYNRGLLRYMGITGDSPIWETFFGLFIVLFIIIVVACVSLIYNAFAISVTERMNQFGLLASIGASKRQLRRSVFLEGLLVALIGIPLGLLLGVGGCALTFHFIGPLIANTIGEVGIPFHTSVAFEFLVFAAILALITVFISVFIPAMRVGTLNPIESIRQNQTGKISSRGIKAAHKATDPEKIWKRRGILARFFGVGGVLAKINTQRNKTKGRAASFSLALAIVLLMTAGSLNTFISDLVTAADNDFEYDIDVSLKLADNTAFTTEQYTFYNNLYDALKGAAGAQGEGWTLVTSTALAVQPNQLSEQYIDYQTSRDGGVYRDDGSWESMGLITYLDDETFDAYAQREGIDPSAYYDPAQTQVIAVEYAYAMHDGKYQRMPTLTSTGSMMLANGEDEITIGALAQNYPDIFGRNMGMIQFIAPASMAANGALSVGDLRFKAAFNANNLSSSEVTLNLDEAFTAFLQSLDQRDDLSISFYSFNDHRTNGESTRSIAFIVNVFCLLFTVILTLIALSNLFNTITNSMILRRREFAVMKSIGMSNKQFRRMISEECLDYSIRGLIPGVVISLVISYLMYSIVGLSMDGLTYAFPWGYFVLAICLIVIAMLISVAYGMHRCKAENALEDLRASAL